MELYLKITAGLLLLIQAFHVTLLQDPTDSPGRTIDRSWLREPVKPAVVSPNAAENKGEDREIDEPDMEPSHNDIITFGSMSMSSGDGADGANGEQDMNATSSGVTIVTATMLPINPNDTANETKLPETTVSQTTPMTSGPTDSSQTNGTRANEEFQNSTMGLQNSTASPTTQNSTRFPDIYNNTYLEGSTSVPETNTTHKSTPETDIDNWVTNSTNAPTNATTTELPEINEASTTSSSTTAIPFETTEDEIIPTTMTAIAPDTPEQANITDKGAASGSNSERGLASDLKKNRRHEAWGAILGTAVAVALVGLVVYVILKKRNQSEFSHRKLVEFSSDPVLRLDNSEPLDLNYGGSAYYNPALQMDNIQMSNFPENSNN
ncbi:uncharacterized protein ACJ7VT_019038 [Polymixia lowei]